MSKTPQRELGLMGWITVMVGAGCVLIAGLSTLNTAFNWKLVLKVGGARTPLPTNYEACLGLLAVGALLIGIAFFGNFVGSRFKAAKGKPLVRLGIVLAAVGFLVVVGRGLQVVALTSTYGSMLAYYATDGDLDDLQAEIDKGPDAEALDRAVSRAAQYDNVPALERLLAGGANFAQATRPEEQRRCPIGSTLAFVKVAVAHGATPATCPGAPTLIHRFVKEGSDDAATAEVVALLRGAGWSASETPKYDKKDAAAWARQNKLPKTAAALAQP